MKTENVLMIILTITASMGLAWFAYSFYGEREASLPVMQNTPENFAKAIESELADKCAAPAGYTDESWVEHMSHHPDRYAECL